MVTAADKQVSKRLKVKSVLIHAAIACPIGLVVVYCSSLHLRQIDLTLLRHINANWKLAKEHKRYAIGWANELDTGNQRFVAAERKLYTCSTK